MKPELKKNIPEFPNHFIYENELYRGQRQETKVFPDSRGVYKVKYKGETYLKTLNQLLGIKDGDVNSGVDSNTRLTVNSLCRQNSTDPSTYRRWLENSGYGSLGDHTIEEHAELIAKRKVEIEFRKKANLQQRCKDNNISYTGYKGFMHRNNLLTHQITPDGHDVLMALYYKSVGKVNLISDEITEKVSLVKKSFNVDYTKEYQEISAKEIEVKQNKRGVILPEHIDEVRVMCVGINTNIDVYKKWIKKNNLNPQTIEEHRELLIRRRKEDVKNIKTRYARNYDDKGEIIDPVLMCFEKGVSIKKYRRRLETKGKDYDTMSRYDHAQNIAIMHRIKEAKKPTSRYF